MEHWNEPTYRQCILPFVVVLTLAICMLVSGQRFSSECCALSLMTSLIAARILSSLHLGNAKRSARTSLDELPPILNVLEGKMSFAGPRPHAVAHTEAYRKSIIGHVIRHKVRPGITGWAQVNELRGETSTIDKMHQRVQYDLDYLKNGSLWLDPKIIARTALILFNDGSAYWQRSATLNQDRSGAALGNR